MFVLAIAGSSRKKGNTSYLVDQALAEAAGTGARTEKIVLCEYGLSPCLVHEDCARRDACALKDDGDWILKEFCAADAVILATPVYYYDVSAWMKTFIDRNWFLRQHGKKCNARAVGMIVVGGGSAIEETVNTLKRYVSSSSFKSIPADRRFVVSGYTNEPGDAANDHDLTSRARAMGRKLVE